MLQQTAIAFILATYYWIVPLKVAFSIRLGRDNLARGNKPASVTLSGVAFVYPSVERLSG